jgi:hypothetical protein
MTRLMQVGMLDACCGRNGSRCLLLFSAHTARNKERTTKKLFYNKKRENKVKMSCTEDFLDEYLLNTAKNGEYEKIKELLMQNENGMLI